MYNEYMKSRPSAAFHNGIGSDGLRPLLNSVFAPLVLFILLFFLPAAAFCQKNDANSIPGGLTGDIMGGIGFSLIEDDGGEMETWINFNLLPELRLGKFGLGLNIDLLWNPNPDQGEDAIRTKDLSAAKIIRYLSYGSKGDKPVYSRLGALSAYSFGNGFIMYNYANQINEDNRKIGLACDFNLEKFGIETMISDFGRKGIIGIRPYTHPLKLLDKNIPVISNLETGLTIVEDFDPDENIDTDDNVNVFGLDIGLPFLEKEHLNLKLYMYWAKISANSPAGKDTNPGGMGAAVGISSVSNGLGILDLAARLERRFLGQEFAPNYFNALYEIEKPGKSYSLIDRPSEQGVFGELSGYVLERFTLKANFQHTDNIKYSGMLHAELKIPDAIPGIRAQAVFDRTSIETIRGTHGLLTLNEFSLAYAEAGYKVRQVPEIIAGIRYEWTFRHNDLTGNIDTIQKVTPCIQVHFAF